MMKCLRHDQRGFTLIELVVALAISGAIAGVLLTSLYQVNGYEAMDRARLTCVKQVENAIHYIVVDAQSAQVVAPSGDADGFPLTLSWTEWKKDDGGNLEHQVIYSIAGQDLTRSYQVGYATPVDMVVARYLDSAANVNKASYASGTLSLEITAAISGFPKKISETRKIDVVTRPDY